MNPTQIRSEVHQMIDRLDEHLLVAIHLIPIAKG